MPSRLQTRKLLKTNVSDIEGTILRLLVATPSARSLQQIQARIITSNLQGNTRVTSQFFRLCELLKSLNDGLRFFLQIPKPHTFLCNTLIQAFAHSPSPKYSLLVFVHMLRNSVSANNFTFPFVLKACSDLRLVSHGVSVHANIIKTGHHAKDLYIQNSLMGFYCSCGDVATARKLFDEMPQRDVVSWTTLISGYTKNERFVDAVFLFKTMQLAGVTPNAVTMVNALSACAQSGELWVGCQVHKLIREQKMKLDVILGTSLINMYAKCGRIEMGMKVFNSMPEKNVFTWNAVINGLAMADSGKRAISLFYRMEEAGVRPDEVTLIGALCACSHAGMVQEGCRIFQTMTRKYGVLPGIKHYGCMVDLLSRAGFIEEAYETAKNMPYEPNTVIWGALLGGCRVNGDLELSEVAARRLVELEPWNGAYIAVLSRLYAELGRWDDAENLRTLMILGGAMKDPGCSSFIEAAN
ncbi:Pentatricopeptide repeat-containing protein [Nymphaea thermarum]|nr:Pentatricopeptide repeat-containing protein [Nymphaea thermarum]